MGFGVGGGMGVRCYGGEGRAGQHLGFVGGKQDPKTPRGLVAISL